MKKNSDLITAAEFEKKFDDSDDIDQHLDFDSAQHANIEIHRINLALPKWMLTCLDREANRLGIPRQAVIKMMIDTMLARKVS